MLPAISHLSAFDAVARRLSFSAAARELQLTQSAVSRQIIALEETLGCKLFQRNRHQVSLTSAGEKYHRDIRDILDALFRATLNLRANPAGGMLNIAILPTFGTRWLAPRLGAFFSEHPGITINLHTRLNPFDLKLEGIDAAIHFGSPEWPGAELDYLMGEDVLPVCAPSLRRDLALEGPSDLLRAPLLHLLSRPRAWTNWFQAMGIIVDQIDGLSIDHFATAAQALAGGFGVALMPTLLIRAELDRGELVPAVDVGPVAGAESYYLAWHRELSSHSPLTTFRNWLDDQARTFREGTAKS
ncbi:MAG: LysR substrate-binding domain-containing protein [Novosphingobium sp.]